MRWDHYDDRFNAWFARRRKDLKKRNLLSKGRPVDPRMSLMIGLGFGALYGGWTTLGIVSLTGAAFRSARIAVITEMDQGGTERLLRKFVPTKHAKKIPLWSHRMHMELNAMRGAAAGNPVCDFIFSDEKLNKSSVMAEFSFFQSLRARQISSKSCLILLSVRRIFQWLRLNATDLSSPLTRPENMSRTPDSGEGDEWNIVTYFLSV
eukprot:GEMP01034416.1.p1 GENE.GEMP01034416.1~~GEMP01034416.1.p1  ORF type:complete len:207 (+),score=33.05 GEMP01034416.1:38-658(+)